MIKEQYCPVCGYTLWFSPWVDENPSDEICPSCGIQFGYDDAQQGEDFSQRSAIYMRWRNKWIQDGMPWFSQSMGKPDNWNPNEQLKRIKRDM